MIFTTATLISLITAITAAIVGIGTLVYKFIKKPITDKKSTTQVPITPEDPVKK